MNNLTEILNDKLYNLEIEEFVKQSSVMSFANGKIQRIVGGTIPALQMVLTYNNISETKFKELRDALQNNHANTFICEFDSDIDKRTQLMTIDASVWAYKDFEFNSQASKIGLFSGKITLITSLFFNFDAYQDLFTQSSVYNPQTSLDTTFLELLSSPYNIVYKYQFEDLFSNIGQSIKYKKDKGGLKKVFTLQYLLKEEHFLELLTYYRKKAGIMGEFGISDLAYNEDNITKARFKNDSFKYNRRIDNLYECEVEIIEVL